MTARILSGKELSEIIRTEIKNDVEKLKAESGITPGLATVLVGEDPASQVYVRNKIKACEKAGILSRAVHLPAETSQEDLLKVVNELNADPEIHGILVQLPIPGHIDENVIINAINPAKDVDGFHPLSAGRAFIGKEDTFLPCTPYGIQVMLSRYEIPTEGAHVVIVGRSNIVGKPIANILVQKAEGANATVTICHSRTRNLPEIVRLGDIIIAAIGRANFITADMIKPGATVIDVGINRVDDASKKRGYRLVGDVDFESVKEVAGAITPVPGGVGPMTITMLLVNTLKSAKRFVPN